MLSTDFFDRPWRSFTLSSRSFRVKDGGRGGVWDSWEDGHLFDSGWVEHRVEQGVKQYDQHGGRRGARQEDGHPARQSAACPVPDRRIAVRDECAAHFFIGIDAPAAFRTVSNMPLHIRGFVVRKLAIHPSNQSS